MALLSWISLIIVLATGSGTSQPIGKYTLSGERLLYTDEAMDSIEKRFGLNGPRFTDAIIDQSIWALKTRGKRMRFFSQWICHQVFFEGSIADGTLFDRVVPGQPLAGNSYKWCDCAHPGRNPMENASKNERIGKPPPGWIYEPSLSGSGIPNIYKVNNRELLGFIHKERVFSKKSVSSTLIDRYYAIGIAISTTGGMTWNYCGDVILPAYDSLGDFNIRVGGCLERTTQKCIFSSNPAGVPYVIKNDSLYLYFNETADNTNWPYPSMAAARLDSVIIHARKFTASPEDWKKFSGTTFSEDPLTGTGAALPGIQQYPNPNDGFADLHSDATYCSATGEYLLTVNEADFAPRVLASIKLYSSTDGIHWTFATYAAGPDSADQPFYSSFISEYGGAADDDHFVGQEFDILYAKRRGRNDMVTDLYYRHVR
jgi:hypothetical protein